MSKIISIDVGIKNLGLCIFCINNDDTIDIVKWQTISLMGGVIRKCDGYTSSKSKCENVAKYKFENECFCGVHKKKGAIEIKKKNAEKVNMVTLGKNMKDVFDELLFDISGVEIVLIENQISPIANRMKTIQGMTAQYFINKNINNVVFVSSFNKLKLFSNKKLSYREKKKLSVEITTKFLNEVSNLKSWSSFFLASKKKDDLADCFLQGYYYLINNQLINKLF